MERRVFIAILLSAVVMYAYQALVPPPPPAAVAPPTARFVVNKMEAGPSMFARRRIFTVGSMAQRLDLTPVWA